MKKKKKHVIRTVLILIIVFIIIFFIFIFEINKRVVDFSKQYILNDNDISKYKYDCAIVLGASVKSDGSPSLMLQDRLDESVYLYNKSYINKIVMSGDHSRDDYNEVSNMKRYVTNKGIPSSSVYLDHYGIKTYDSMYRLRTTFNVSKTLIVTQEYHLYRAIYIARKLGMEAYGIPSNPREYTNQWYRDLREILARVKDYFKVANMSDSTYKSDRVYLNESGDITNERK